jgi:zinc-finger-containing domain
MSKVLLICPYCSQPAKCVGFSDKLYPYQADYGWLYVCGPCQAYVGCHKGGQKPLGSLANAELRALRHEAHLAFDPLWQAKMRKSGATKAYVRSAGYAWLASELGLPVSQMHIGQLNIEQCQRVIEICQYVAERNLERRSI